MINQIRERRTFGAPIENSIGIDRSRVPCAGGSVPISRVSLHGSRTPTAQELVYLMSSNGVNSAGGACNDIRLGVCADAAAAGCTAATVAPVLLVRRQLLSAM